MRSLVIITCLMLAGCSRQDWSAKTEALSEKLEQALAWWVDSDYTKCMVPVIADIAAKDDTPEFTNFAAILGEDPTPQMLSELERADVAVRPLSLYREADYEVEKCKDVSNGGGVYQCPDGHIPYLIRIRAIRGGPGSQYRVMAERYCGFLCAASMEYLVEPSQDGCAIVSEKLIWVS